MKLSSLAIGGNIIYPSSGDYLKKNITLASGIFLHERENRFSVGFTTQNYGNSSRIRFAYRLEGYEEEWNELSRVIVWQDMQLSRRGTTPCKCVRRMSWGVGRMK